MCGRSLSLFNLTASEVASAAPYDALVLAAIGYTESGQMLPPKEVRIRPTLSTLASLVTAAVLLYTGGVKLFRMVLHGSTGVLLPQPLGIFIPVYEVLLGGGMIAAPRSRHLQVLSVVTLSAFLVYSLRYLSFGAVQDCGCGLPAFLNSEKPWLLILRNVLLVSIASLPLFIHKLSRAEIPFRMSPSAASLLALLLLQVSFLGAGSGALAADSLADFRPTSDRPVMLGAEIVRNLTRIAPRGARDFLIVYASPDCRSCTEACSTLAVLARQGQSEGIETILVSAVDEARVNDFAAGCVPGSIGLSDVGSRVARALDVQEAPYLALVRDRVRLVAVGFEYVRMELKLAEAQVTNGQRQ